jgi:murein DD-endopeptidase MepM/ murein hydrolase activator NlpD
VYKHEVQRGQTLSEIAEIYSINPATIKWANELTSDTLKVGQVLKIPEIDGVFVTVKKGDTFDSLVAKHGSDRVSIIDLNSNLFDRVDPQLKEGMEIFIPGGVIPTPKRVYTPPRNTGGSGGNPNPPIPNVPPGTFVHPLGTDPGCSGWTWSRGFSSYHKGADLAKKGGCVINAAGSGTILRARWGNGGEGYHVVVDHGNGIWTRYYHGTGRFYVSEGQKVVAGQPIMNMGCTGNCFGTHLHFEVVLNGIRVNPENYVRLR